MREEDNLHGRTTTTTTTTRHTELNRSDWIVLPSRSRRQVNSEGTSCHDVQKKDLENQRCDHAAEINVSVHFQSVSMLGLSMIGIGLHVFGNYIKRAIVDT